MYDSDGDGDGSVKDGMELSTDVETLRSCALREAFEETGILPLKPGPAVKMPHMHAHFRIYQVAWFT